MNDDYEHLGPNMRARLDAAELQQAKVRDWIALMAERGDGHYLIARELCLLLGYAQPRRPV
jgi:truncated hemoglobin YjbI